MPALSNLHRNPDEVGTRAGSGRGEGGVWAERLGNPRACFSSTVMRGSFHCEKHRRPNVPQLPSISRPTWNTVQVLTTF